MWGGALWNSIESIISQFASKLLTHTFSPATAHTFSPATTHTFSPVSPHHTFTSPYPIPFSDLRAVAGGGLSGGAREDGVYEHQHAYDYSAVVPLSPPQLLPVLHRYAASLLQIILQIIPHLYGVHVPILPFNIDSCLLILSSAHRLGCHLMSEV